MSTVFTEKLPSDPLSSPTSCRGFTFVEVMVSMAVTLVVMGAIFGLLARGFRTTDVEFERSDLQAQARSALDQISRDLLLAGTGLPPEFPAFTPPRVNPELDASGGGPEAIEIVGYFDKSAAGVGPVAIVSFDGRKVRTEVLPAHIEQGDLILVFDDQPTKGTWLFGLVSSIDMVSSGSGYPIQELTIKSQPGESEGDVTLPSFIDHYNRPAPASGFITPVTVVSYRTAPNDSGAGGGEVLWRQVNWGEPTQVALVEDLQFRYFIGGTVDDSGSPPIAPRRPFGVTPPGESGPFIVAETSQSYPPQSTSNPSGDAGDQKPGDDEGLEFPPKPQPNPLVALRPDQLVTGVSISVTSRSDQANLEGSTVRSGESSAEAGFLRVTFASTVAARNIMFRLSSRENFEFN